MTRTAHPARFISHDGASLSYWHWPAQTASSRSILLFHRGHEHGRRLQHLVDELNLPDVSFYAWDARGHGLSEGARGYAPNFGALVRDAQVFFEHLQHEHGVQPEQTQVVAQSVGAVIAAAWIHDYAPRLRGMVLASPAFSVKLYVPGAVPGLTLLQKLRGPFFVSSYVKSRFLTHDKSRQESFDADPLITRDIASNILLELYRVADRLVQDAAAIQVPTLFLVSGADFVVRKEPQQTFFSRLGAADKRYLELPGFYHDTLGEAQRGAAVQSVAEFINRKFEEPMWSASKLRDAHHAGYTYEEYQALRRPLCVSPKGLAFAVTRALLAGPGRLSQGIQVGLQTGFDSGSMLDYVYRDKAEGWGPLGRFIDRQYLNAIGWVGIRQRRQHLIETLKRAIREVRAAGLPVRILDIAAGHGRYVLDALKAADLQEGDSALLRDYSDLNVAAGQALIQKMGLTDKVRFVKGDAFDGMGLARLEPRPTLVVVSGLYELFPDNDSVTASLQGLAAAVPEGGRLIYTGQPWHPQLEFIARVLTSHRDGADWVMRRRTQLELDELVRGAGFEKTSGVADTWGIFTVSLAKK